MKLLILTQKMNKNDPILGFFQKWIDEFLKHFSVVTVICLEEGEYEKRQNLNVYSLGKEKGLKKWQIALNFYKYIFSLRKEYDYVFIHMNPIYAIMGAWMWRTMRKKIGLWYVHRAVTLSLRLTTLMVNHIFTSAPQSFNIESGKVNYLGHGIYLECNSEIKKTSSNRRISFVVLGRLSQVKRIDIAIRTIAELRKNGIDAVLSLVGDAVTEDDIKYKTVLERTIAFFDLNRYVKFFESVPHDNICEVYGRADVLINTSPDGGMDKVVLESWIAGTPCFTTNGAFKNVFDQEGSLFYAQDEAELVKKVLYYAQNRNDVTDVVRFMSKKIKENFSLSGLIESVTRIYTNNE